MSPPPFIQHRLLRAITRYGPSVTNAQISTVTKQNKWAISMAIMRAEKRGYITVKNKGRKTRELHITKLGYDFLEQQDEKVVHIGIITKPSAAYQGESKKRHCLSCKNKFHSSWPGERICKECKQGKEWKSPAAAAFTAQEVT